MMQHIFYRIWFQWKLIATKLNNRFVVTSRRNRINEHDKFVLLQILIDVSCQISMWKWHFSNNNTIECYLIDSLTLSHSTYKESNLIFTCSYFIGGKHPIKAWWHRYQRGVRWINNIISVDTEGCYCWFRYLYVCTSWRSPNQYQSSRFSAW